MDYGKKINNMEMLLLKKKMDLNTIVTGKKEEKLKIH